MAAINVVQKLACPGGDLSCLIRTKLRTIETKKILVPITLSSPGEQRLTFCLMNHGNPRGKLLKYTYLQNNQLNQSMKISLPLSSCESMLELHNLYFITWKKQSEDILYFCPEEALKYSIGHKFFGLSNRVSEGSDSCDINKMRLCLRTRPAPNTLQPSKLRTTYFDCVNTSANAWQNRWAYVTPDILSYLHCE